MLLGTVLYAVVFLVNTDGFTDTNLVPLVVTAVIWNTALLVVAVLVIIDSIRKIRAGMTRELASGVFVVKLAAFPFFLISSGLLTLIYLAGWGILLFGGPVLGAAAMIGAGLTYLAMLATSVYGWACIARLRRERRIDTGLLVAYSFLLFIPVADTVVGVLLFLRYGRTRTAIAEAQVAEIEP